MLDIIGGCSIPIGIAKNINADRKLNTEMRGRCNRILPSLATLGVPSFEASHFTLTGLFKYGVVKNIGSDEHEVFYYCP